MTSNVAILCVAAFAAIALATSVGVGVSLRLFESAIDRLAANAKARLCLVASLLPFAVAAVVMTAALAPSFGWIADHCGPGPNLHGHPHICGHHVAGLPAVSLVVLAALLAVRLGVTSAYRVYALALARWTRQRLDAVAVLDSQLNAAILPLDEAQAFVIGLLSPKLYITRGLLAERASTHLASVLEHERAHMRRRDPLRRFVASFGLSFHLPGIARWLDRKLGCAQEMTADIEAARAVGSGHTVAQALVELSRQARAPRVATAFAGSDIEARVMNLLDDRLRRDWPTPPVLAMIAGATLIAVAAGADAVHHGVEMLLGLLG